MDVNTNFLSSVLNVEVLEATIQNKTLEYSFMRDSLFLNQEDFETHNSINLDEFIFTNCLSWLSSKEEVSGYSINCNEDKSIQFMVYSDEYRYHHDSLLYLKSYSNVSMTEALLLSLQDIYEDYYKEPPD